MKDQNDQEGLADLVARGGIHYDVEGNSPRELLTGLIARISLPPYIEKERLLAAMLEREELMPTGIGDGIALPHPRNPVVDRGDRQFVSVAFPARPVPWNALDGKAVHTVILIVSASPKCHLYTLSKINFLCKQDRFYALLEERAAAETIIAAIGEAERAWNEG
ncbi:MAG: PTS sugar transporter subunit IIA [Treponema sp.]|jgi:PTS system nitrogen regulatory IIA component|nr:PTS sugar transporter subunit IIA [Treponema sp.]